MATTTDYTNGAAGRSWDGSNRAFILKNQVTVGTLVTVDTDVLQSLDIPSYTWVQKVWLRVNTPSTAACDSAVGDADSAAGWEADTGFDLNAAANTVTTSLQTSEYADGKLYIVDDTIDVTVNGASAGAVYTIYALCFDLN